MRSAEQCSARQLNPAFCKGLHFYRNQPANLSLNGTIRWIKTKHFTTGRREPSHNTTPARFAAQTGSSPFRPGCAFSLPGMSKLDGKFDGHHRARGCCEGCRKLSRNDWHLCTFRRKKIGLLQIIGPNRPSTNTMDGVEFRCKLVQTGKN